MANQKQAVIIGAGIAGIASAIRLSCLGFSVSVFEKNNYPGGKISHFIQDGFQFDAGPSVFTQPGLIEELFALAGEPIQEYFSFRKLPESCRYFFSNGKRVTAWADHAKFAQEMDEQLGEPKESLQKYLQRSADLYTRVGELFLTHSLHRPLSFSFKEIKHGLSAVRWPYLFHTLDAYNQKSFQTKEAVQLFNRYATYNGSNPYRAPAMLSLIPHLELNEGTYYPKGGMVSIAHALYNLAINKGVDFHFNTSVEKIETSGGKVTGVIAEGKFHSAPLVVSNQDVYFTYKHLLNDEARAEKVLKQERSSSALIFYWGIGQEFSQLGLHNIFFSEHYKEEFNHIFNDGDVGEEPTIYLNITSKMEKEMAPKGKENWFIMVNVPSNTGQDWEAQKAATRKRVLEKLGNMLDTNIEALIETEATLDPLTIESNTMSFMGSLYGTSSNSKLAAFLRHPNFSKIYKGLFFVGGSVHPGGGIPLCLRSAAIMTEIAAKEFE